MRFDSVSILDAQRRAYKALTAPFIVSSTIDSTGKAQKSTKKNPHYTPPKLTTSPAMLVQELPWVNTTKQFVFDFSISGPQQVPGVNNNIVIAKNDTFAVYGVQMLIATGTNAADFIYRSHGVLPTDDAIYNSFITMTIESSTYVTKMEGQFFRDNPANSNEYFGEIGLQLINPIRLISGEQGKYNVTLNLKNPTSPLVISANTLISMRLHGVYGQAQG